MVGTPLGFIRRASALLRQKTARLDADELRRFVQSFLDRRELFLSTLAAHSSPLYVIDTLALTARARRFRQAFAVHLPNMRLYYALKSNSHPVMARTLVREGVGLDVSSGLELEAALAVGATEIVFSGPAKQPSELTLATAHPERVTVLIDSFAELDRLETIAAERGVTMRAGVRLTTDDSGIWRKFGIPLGQLGRFMGISETHRHVSLCGLQFHMSWNMNPGAQVGFISRLGSVLRQLDQRQVGRVTFLDIGGGFWPEEGEWLQPAATPRGTLFHTLMGYEADVLDHRKQAASRIDEFAGAIASALGAHIFPLVRPTICLEPGRWLCNDGMHILLTVADRKLPEVVVTDGGTNAVGWDRFESDYFPVINLSRPGLEEQPCLVAGSLCTPHDLWGYSYFGKDIEAGDVLLIPNQGAYTYSLRQQFIKPLPESAVLAS